MAEVKIVDIQGLQWSMKDETARNKITEQETKINNLQDNLNNVDSKIYVNQSKDFDVNSSEEIWLKIENAYPIKRFASNIFSIGTRRGGIYLLSCSLDDNNDYWTPTLIKLNDTLNRIISAKVKEGIIYIKTGGYNSIYIQQLNNTPKQITITVEEPPIDATDITIIEK